MVPGATRLLSAIRRQKYDLVHIHRSARRARNSILQVTRGTRTASTSWDFEDVVAGVALGVDTSGPHPRLAVNITAARLEQVRLPAQLLSISRILR